ncbi:MAG: hypothetical protein D8M57_05445 [Candidatus Scalindua sp. AMX11]|nr:MAG: hypothetical protein DWQ00_07340 [Candidatus Scalindua sp.]NOG85942.1 hypothetical protein [Planctomycetota bacterium]RZV91425.1 MAG: hypothetical protein EX341_05710 [Candidatus Scalindua sp. SCAELEC01]TDE65984.1 MAG: hypothetical protein D8M57_05445 [Candidatus Scalindua sp. AMX11]GJQ59292.1 MAG: diacylglycerol kinase [Candidatus Scalindua sp.]
MKKILFIINPVSGRLTGQSLRQAIISELDGVLAHDSFDVEYSAQEGETGDHARFSDYEIVVVAGGDGTVSQVVKVIAGLEKKPKLGIIPIGTGNDLANSVGILQCYKSEGLGSLLQVILRSEVVKMDILSLNNRDVFSNYLGLGRDAKISSDFHRLRFKPVSRAVCRCLSNKVFYGLLVLKSLFYWMSFDIEIEYKNQDFVTEVVSVTKGFCGILITNTKMYAGGVKLSSKCRMDDGKFEVTVIRGFREWFHMAYALLFKKPLDTISPKLIQFQTDRLVLKFTGETFCQVDGERYDNLAKGKEEISVSVVSSLEIIKA